MEVPGSQRVNLVLQTTNLLASPPQDTPLDTVSSFHGRFDRYLILCNPVG